MLLSPVLLALVAAAPEAPAAVQICLELPEGVSLYAEDVRRDYRRLDDGGAILDLDVQLDGKPPLRITRAKGACFRAWVPPQRLGTIAVSFARTHENLLPAEASVKLALKPDLWFDGGTLPVIRGPFSSVRTELAGELKVTRVLPSGATEELTDLSDLPAGRYRLDLVPLRRPCPVAVNLKGVGTIRADRRPEQYATLLATYREDILPRVLEGKQRGLCRPEEALQVGLTMHDGVFLSPYSPSIATVLTTALPSYRLRRDGQTSAYELGQDFTLGHGQHVALEVQAPVVTAGR